MSALGAVGWALVGGAAGVGIRRLSVWLAGREELEAGKLWWQVYGPPALAAVLFGLFALHLGFRPVLLLQSFWIAVFVQIIFFDLEHRLILDVVQFPAMAIAILSSVLLPGIGWKDSLIGGLSAGLAFLLFAILGALIFRAEAMGLGDVKLAALMGFLLGVLPPGFGVFRAAFLGILLAGGTSIVMILTRVKTMKDTLAYGPYLALGALVLLYQSGG
ncbi:MAG TPA: A24 family peptidase [Candidatus Dormibacteraeota bacterium]|nr:A24 family peptidase [Candidatus Dormibacteraeota bacterium]